MKTKTLKESFGGFLTAALLICLLASCSNPFASQTDPTTGAEGAGTTGSGSGASATTGSLSITIPALAPWLTADLASKTASKSLGSKATAFTSKATITVSASDGTTIATTTKSLGYLSGLIGSSLSLDLPYVPAGDNYTVKLSCYNANVSSSSPSVEGQATGVSVSAGKTTDVTICCLPVSPVSLAVGSSASASLGDYCEAWYSVPVSPNFTYHLAIDNPNLRFAAFNTKGVSLGYSSSYVKAVTGESDTTLYVAVANVNNGGVQSGTLSVSTTEPVLNEGSDTTPVVLDLNMSHTFKRGPSGSGQERSYYSFTTAGAGDYILDTGSSTCSVYFSTKKTTDTYECTASSSHGGLVMSTLTAGTPYYIILVETSSFGVNSTGAIYSPGNYSLENEGSMASPVELILGNQKTVKVGSHGYDLISYYKLATGTSGVDYQFSFSGLVSGSCEILVFADSTFSGNYLDSCNLAAWKALSPMSTVFAPNRDYYIMIFNKGSSILSFNLTPSSVAEPTILPLPVEASWTQGTIPSDLSPQWYSANVKGGSSYTLNSDSRFSPSSAYTAYAQVSAFQSDRCTAYFLNYGSGNSFTVPGTGETTLFIRVSDNGSGSGGTYALQLVEK